MHMHAHADCYWNFVGPEPHSQFSIANSIHSGMHNLLTETESPCWVVLSKPLWLHGPGKIRVWWEAQTLLDQFGPYMTHAWIKREWAWIDRERPFLSVKGHFPQNWLFWDFSKLWHQFKRQDIHSVLDALAKHMDLLKGILCFPIGKSVY